MWLLLLLLLFMFMLVTQGYHTREQEMKRVWEQETKYSYEETTIVRMCVEDAHVLDSCVVRVDFLGILPSDSAACHRKALYSAVLGFARPILIMDHGM